MQSVFFCTISCLYIYLIFLRGERRQRKTVPGGVKSSGRVVHLYCLLLRAGEEEAFGGGERVAEVAAVTVGTGLAGEHHAADLRLVARVADDRAELGNAVRELALVAVGARPRLLPLVAQLRLEHALVVHLQFHSTLLLRLLAFRAGVRAHVQALLRRHEGECNSVRCRSCGLCHSGVGKKGQGGNRTETHRAVVAHGRVGRAWLAVVGDRRGGSLGGQVHLEVVFRADGDALGQHAEILGRRALRGERHGALLLAAAKPAGLLGDGDGGGLLAAEKREAARDVAVGDAELGVLAAERLRLVHGLGEAGEAELVAVGHLLVMQREACELEPVARDVVGGGGGVAVVDDGGGGGRRERDGGSVRRRRGEAEARAEGGRAAEQGVVAAAGEVARRGEALVAEGERLELKCRGEAVGIHQSDHGFLHCCVFRL
jgi:hypothetical protein